MLTKEQIQANKDRFIELINSITLEGCNKEGLLNWLGKSDFFEAPASVKYHCNYPGGLCEHSLNVYDNLNKLVIQFASHFKYEESADGKEGSETLVPHYTQDSIKIVALLHDISKTNFYEQYEKNVKNDEGVWIKVKEYKTREADNRFVYGSHEQNSEFIAHTFFPLSVEESVAILHHHGGMSWDSAQDAIGEVYAKFPLAVLLHLADMSATFINETRNESAH